MSERKKLEKLNAILDLLKKHKGIMEFGKLYGQIALKYGTSYRTFWEYLDVLRMAGKIEYPQTHMKAQEEYIEIKLL